MAQDTDFLVIGTGLAGLAAALRLAPHGRVLLVSKAPPQESATAYAQGGIAAVTDAHDTFAAHVADTLRAGAGLCREDVVNTVVSEGPGAIDRLVAAEVAFDKCGSAFDLTCEGGHSARRILHAADLTGQEISRALRAVALRHPNVTQLSGHLAVDLITTRKLGCGQADRCVGAYVYDMALGRVEAIRARATLLATGGAGKVYLYTSNPDVATGDGAAIANMEFFQFHPTCLFHPGAKSFLISESLRGEGAILRRHDGAAFMQGVHPLADLAPRDIVARAIDAELKRSGAAYITLDITGHDAAFVMRRFPNIYRSCLAVGIDMTRAPIPVVPAAHDACGGVQTDLWGATNLPGLYAAGETAYTGLHGANRLASNSLLEAAVLGERAGISMQAYAHSQASWVPVAEWDTGNAAAPDEMVVVSHNWDALRRTMWNYVGIVRTDRRLDRAMTRVDNLQQEIEAYYWDFRLTRDLIELRNLALVAQLIIASARHRRESRGLHFNLDCPVLAAQARATVASQGAHRGIVFAPPAKTP